MNRFAVVDVETTGFGRTDRIVEIGIVLVDGNEIIQEWETLINPERDISNSNIHGITADTVSLAPIFTEVVDEVSSFLDGRIFVAHNISFDSRMLQQEFNRSKKEIDFGKGYCTLQATCLKLEKACAKFGVLNSNAHRALTDARATALILGQVFRDSESWSPMNIRKYSKNQVTRTLSRAALDQSYSSGHQNLRRIVRNFELSGFSGARLSYLDALSSVMSDFEITADEAKNLGEWANDLGITQEQKNEIHLAFFNLVVEAANRDGYISETESILVEKAALALGIEVPRLEHPVEIGSQSYLKRGTKVCFTGEARDSDGNPLTREGLEEIAVAMGLVPVEGVTRKSCDLLVAADKSSMSGKTKKARDFGIRVISVSEFLSIV
jgi:DNA polymerase-3 subunit epsilon